MRVWFSDSEQWSSPAKPPRSQNYVKPHDARNPMTRARAYMSQKALWPNLGAGLQPVKQERASDGSQASGGRRGVLVVSVDPNGPAARAGILVGDTITAWSGQPIDVREIMRLLGPESIGSTVDLGLIRGGAPTALQVVIGERPVA
jgi:S1-C subfamily serine protease